jgi:hypothetical protein
MSGAEDARLLEPDLDLAPAEPEVKAEPPPAAVEKAEVAKPVSVLTGAQAMTLPILPMDNLGEDISPLSAFDNSEDSFDAMALEGLEELAQPAPMETLFEQAENGEITGDDFDQKIDEALELAERLKRSEEGQDDLDIPAFLREGMKDLSLD